jgi:hypothetical protein
MLSSLCVDLHNRAQGSTVLHCLRSYLGGKHQTRGFGPTGSHGSTLSRSIPRGRDFVQRPGICKGFQLLPEGEGPLLS